MGNYNFNNYSACQFLLFSRNREAPDWVKCKESLFEQVVFKKCTPSAFNRPNLDNTPIENQEFPVEGPEN